MSDEKDHHLCTDCVKGFTHFGRDTQKHTGFTANVPFGVQGFLKVNDFAANYITNKNFI